MLTTKAFTSLNYLPNLIIVGSNGSGRRASLLYFLRRLFNFTEAIKMSSEEKTIKISESNEKQITVLFCQLYLEISPRLIGPSDSVVMQSLIKEIAGIKQVYSKLPYRIILISEAEKLSSNAQHSLRRTIEKHSNNARFIFITNHLDSIKPAIQSRCSVFIHPAPAPEVLKAYLGNIEECSLVVNRLSSTHVGNLNSDKFLVQNKPDAPNPQSIVLSPEFTQDIIEKMGRNYELDIAIAETYFLDSIVSKKGSKKSIDLKNRIPYWVSKAKLIGATIVKSPSLTTIKNVRGEFLDLEKSGIFGEDILEQAALSIAGAVDKDLGSIVCLMASLCEEGMLGNEKKVLQMEAFVTGVVKLMALVKEINKPQMKSDLTRKEALNCFVDDILGVAY